MVVVESVKLLDVDEVPTWREMNSDHVIVLAVVTAPLLLTRHYTLVARCILSAVAIEMPMQSYKAAGSASFSWWQCER